MAATKEGPLAKSYVLIPFVLVCAGVVSAAVAPIVKSPADSLLGKDVPLYRVLCRCAAALAVILLIVFRKYLKSRVRASINPKQYPPGKPFIGGFLVGLVALITVAVVMVALGGAGFIVPEAGSAAFWKTVGTALGTALMVAFFEEIFFRGIVFQGFQADLGTGLATIIAGAFFSLVHFMQPRKLPSVSGANPLDGFRILGHAFDRFGNFSEILPFAIGLFLVALLLTVAYLRTSSLYLPMGLHASLVFFIGTSRLFIEYGKKASPLLFGSADPHPSFLRGVDALPTWIMFVVLTIVIGAIAGKLQPKGAPKAPTGKTSSK